MLDQYVTPSPATARAATAAETLLALFAAQVRARPGQIALQHGETALDYRQLDDWSSQLAARLTERGVGPGSLVALAADRGVGAVAGVLAVLKAGAGYVGLDPAIPARRQRRIVEETRPDAVLAEPGLDQFPTLDAPRVPLVRTDDTPSPGAPEVAPSPAGDPDRLFHIVYTSGTTGDPKGVRISCRSVLNRLEWMWREYPFPEGSVLAVQKALSLVASPWELLGGLLAGVPSVVLPREEVLDPQLFAQAVQRHRITHLFLTPHLINGLLDGTERLGGADRSGGAAEHRPVLVTSGADALPVATVLRFRTAFPGTLLLNLYGMTETASNIAAYDTSALAEDAQRVPVGRPVAGAVISVRDRLSRPLPPGVTGEVWVSGTPLALGYVGGHDSDRFVTDTDGSVRYRTGDRGRVLTSGDLEITGRTDNQVKIRGYRVELEEIEATLRKSPAVSDAGVLVLGAADDPQLVGCVTAVQEADPAALRAFLRDRLPDYMLPARIVVVPSLPTAGNGKVDRAALATLAERAAEGVREQFAAADDTEQAVADLWQQLLGAAPASREDNFFDCGGHSLLAIRLANRLEREFQRGITLRQVLESPTLAGLIALCRA